MITHATSTIICICDWQLSIMSQMWRPFYIYLVLQYCKAPLHRQSIFHSPWNVCSATYTVVPPDWKCTLLGLENGFFHRATGSPPLGIKFPLKRKGCQVVVSVLIVFVRHLRNFVNASRYWYTVSPLPKIDDTSHCSSQTPRSDYFHN